MDGTSSKKRRSSNWSPSELDLLVDLVEVNKKVLFSSFTNTITNTLKQRTWDDIATRLSANSTDLPRTWQESKKKWTDYKCQVKKRASAIKTASRATGGGPAPKDLTKSEEKVIAIIPKCQLVGIEGGLESEMPVPPDDMNSIEIDCILQEPFAMPLPVDLFKALGSPEVFNDGSPLSLTSSNTITIRSPVIRFDSPPTGPPTVPPTGNSRRKQKRTTRPMEEMTPAQEILKIEKEKVKVLKKILKVQKKRLRVEQKILEKKEEKLEILRNEK